MLNIGSILILLTAIGNITLGILVFAKDQKKLSHRVFAYFTLILSVWITTSYFSNYIPTELIRNWFVRIDFASAALTAFTFLLFAYFFPNYQKLYADLVVYFFFICTLILVYLSLFTSLIIENITYLNPGVSYHSGVFDLIYSVFLIIELISGLVLIYRQVKISSSTYKTQAQYVLISTLIPAFIVIVGTLIISRILNINNSESRFVAIDLPNSGRFSILIFTLMTAYAILKERLFGIRIFLSRVVYIIILLLIQAGVFSMMWIINMNIRNEIYELFLLSIVSTLLLIIFNSIIWPVLQRYITQVFWEDEEIIKTYNLDLVNVEGLEGLENLLFHTISKLLNPRKQMLILYDQGFDPNFKINEKGFEDLEIQAIMGEKAINCLTNLPKEITEVGEIKVIKEIDIGIDYVIKINHQGIGGLYLLGSKENKQKYTQKEIDLVGKLLFYFSLSAIRLSV